MSLVFWKPLFVRARRWRSSPSAPPSSRSRCGRRHPRAAGRRGARGVLAIPARTSRCSPRRPPAGRGICRAADPRRLARRDRLRGGRGGRLAARRAADPAGAGTALGATCCDDVRAALRHRARRAPPWCCRPARRPVVDADVRSLVVSSDIFAYATGLRSASTRWRRGSAPRRRGRGSRGAAVATIVIATVLSPLAAGPAVWFGPMFGAVILVRHARRSRRVDDQARHRREGHVVLAARSRRDPRPARLVLPSAAAALLLFFATPEGIMSTMPSTFPRDATAASATTRRRSTSSSPPPRAEFDRATGGLRAGRHPADRVHDGRGGYATPAVDAALERLEDAFAVRERDRAVRGGGSRPATRAPGSSRRRSSAG